MSARVKSNRTDNLAQEGSDSSHSRREAFVVGGEMMMTTRGRNGKRKIFFMLMTTKVAVMKRKFLYLLLKSFSQDILK